jgi:plasmid stabilization system protein ParE
VKPVLFRPAAAADVEDAYNWYEQQRDGLGREFLAEVRRCVLALQRRPERAAILHRNTRRLLLSRFPYALYYRIFDDRILVVACLHGRREPRVWKARGRCLTSEWTGPA